jgi:hypothetical protein
MANMLAFLSNYKNLPLVSIGSGNGLFEKLILKKNESTQIICIDPNPKSYSKIDVQLNPDYSYDIQLTTEKPDIINNCVLLLNWCCPNNSSYDYDAIINIKPVAFICIYETFMGSNGAAGGERFYGYIRNTKNYKLIHSTIGMDSGLLIEWYQKSDYNLIPKHQLDTCVV